MIATAPSVIYKVTMTSGAVIELRQDRRGEQTELAYVGDRAMVVYDLPLNEVVVDFDDRLESISRGYASFDDQMLECRVGDLVEVSMPTCS